MNTLKKDELNKTWVEQYINFNQIDQGFINKLRNKDFKLKKVDLTY